MGALTQLVRWPFRVAGSLQRALLLFVVLPLVIAAALGIRIGFDQVNHFQQSLLKSDLELIARAISLPVGEALARNDSEAVAMALQSVFTIDRVYGASVFDVNGERVASGGIAERDLTNSLIPGRIQATGEKQEAYRRVAGRRVFSHFFPLFDSHGQSTGFVQITRREGDFVRSLQHITAVSWGLWGMLALMIVITVLVGHYGGIGRYVDRLLGAMAAVEKGSSEQRVAAQGPREVAALARGLNSMLDAIQHSEQQLAERRATEHRLLLELKENEKLAAIGRVARGFAHELGAPLSVIDGRARRLLRRNLVAAGSESEVEDIRHQVRHLTSTVRQLLDYSRPLSRQWRRYDLAQVLVLMEEVVVAERQPGDPQLKVEAGQPVPLLDGDPDRLLLALLNVVRNAIQAADQQVVVGVSVSPIAVEIAVEDDGPGLSTLDLARLVEPFYTTKVYGEGTGLGLSITHSIVLEHGGTLVAANREEGGCRMLLTLPLDSHKEEPAHHA